MNTPDHPDLPPPDEARAALHAWLDTCDDEVVLAWWQLVYWLTRPVGGGREG
jgi:hypothetical protein